MSMAAAITLLITFNFLLVSSSSSPTATPPPLPILPIPTASQLKWQLSETSLFLHFGLNTFTNSEWGSGHEPPSLFNPSSSLDTSQWASVAKSNHFSRIILTVKHHDGFLLFPSQYTNYSLSSSPYLNGSADILADLAASCRAAGIGLGVYLSPWDRHERSYGKTVEYNEYYVGQMREVLGGYYGDVEEVWLDGAKGEGEKDMEYFFNTWFDVIHQLQPGALVFSDDGPDCRWVGDEAGVAAETCWSLFNKSAVTIGHTDTGYSQHGDPHGIDWVPAECDVSIRPGWFWHQSEHPKSAAELLDIYYKSVGRNCLLILNVPPNSSGLISDEDIQVLREFTALRTSIFSVNFAENATITASSVWGGGVDTRFGPSNVLEEDIYTYWAPKKGASDAILQLNLGRLTSFNVLLLQEPIQMGQRVIKFQVEVVKSGEWKTIVYGTTIGYKRILRFPMVETQFVRLSITNSRDVPLISYIAIHVDAFNFNNDKIKTNSFLNGSDIIRLPHNLKRSMKTAYK